MSNGYTLVAKVVVAVFDLFVLVLSLALGGLSLGPFIFFAALVVVIQAPIGQALEVVAQDDGLHIRGLRAEAVVPYGNIQDVRATWRTSVVHIVLRPESAFESPIVFLPAWGYARPAVDALRQRLPRSR